MPLTTYHESELGKGELTGIRANDKALSEGELDRMDREGFARVNQLLVSIGGPTVAGALIQGWIAGDNIDAVPSFIRLMAEKCAAAEAFHRWEQYNLGVASRDDRDHRRDSERLKEEVMDMANNLKVAKVIVNDDGTIIDLTGSDRNAGPVVSGPMANGSLFSSVEYRDERNRRQTPKHTDPFFH